MCDEVGAAICVMLKPLAGRHADDGADVGRTEGASEISRDGEADGAYDGL